MTEIAGIWTRLNRRLEHGLLTQEFLDRLAKLGLCCYPYYVVREEPLERNEIDAHGTGLAGRFLNDSELSEVSSIPERPRELERIRSRLQYGKCFGVWVDGRFAAYSWYSAKHLPTVIGARTLCRLPPNTLYLYDAFVRPEFRGREVAGFMRHKLHESLHAEGADEFVSISMAFNRSTRRFKRKLGARETELRLLLTLGVLGGVDVCLRQTEQFLSIPHIVRLRHNSAPRI